MLAAAAPATAYGAPAPPGAPRLSVRGIAIVVAVHVGVLALLASIDAVPLPAPLATLMVQIIPPAPPPAPEIVPPKPLPAVRKPVPVERKPVRPVPVTQPTPVQASPMLAAHTEAPSAAGVAAGEEAPPPPAPPAPPAPASLSPPRFDADYLHNPHPAYPTLSRRMGEEGKVVLRVFVEPAGRPSQVEIKASSGSSRLDEAAQEAVRRWKFVPARRGDEAVGAWVLVPILFNLNLRD